MTPNEPLPDALFEVELKEGEDWGVKLTDSLRIVAIRSGGPFDGKCLVGDQIVEVNGTTVNTIDEFEKFTIENGPILEINIARGLKTTLVTLLPPEREKNVRRKDGYSYHLAQVDYQRGRKFGLGIKHFRNKVLVSRVDDGKFLWSFWKSIYKKAFKLKKDLNNGSEQKPKHQRIHAREYKIL